MKIVEPSNPGAGSHATSDVPKTLELEARDRLVLRCGEASVELWADGRIVIHGGYVETYAEGTNRIKGAQVRIN
jgi:hypothetical protein